MTYCFFTIYKSLTSIVTLHETTSIVVGQTETLIATIAPTNPTNSLITWTSSDESIATVSNEGVVTAVAYGSTTITATTDDGSFHDEVTVNVIYPALNATITPEYITQNYPGNFNREISLTVNATGGSGTYTYEYVVTKLNGSSQIVTENDNVISWEETGTLATMDSTSYIVEVTITDSINTEKVVTYNVSAFE